jgi:hypothetical protein
MWLRREQRTFAVPQSYRARADSSFCSDAAGSDRLKSRCSVLRTAREQEGGYVVFTSGIAPRWSRFICFSSMEGAWDEMSRGEQAHQGVASPRLVRGRFPHARSHLPCTISVAHRAPPPPNVRLSPKHGCRGRRSKHAGFICKSLHSSAKAPCLNSYKPTKLDQIHHAVQDREA